MQRRGHGRASLSIRRFPELPFRPRGPSPCASSPPPPDELGWPELKQPVTQDMNMGTVVAKALSWAAGSRRTHGQPAPDSPCEEGAPLLTQGPAFLRLWAPPPPFCSAVGLNRVRLLDSSLPSSPLGPGRDRGSGRGACITAPPARLWGKAPPPGVGEPPHPARNRGGGLRRVLALMAAYTQPPQGPSATQLLSTGRPALRDLASLPDAVT